VSDPLVLDSACLIALERIGQLDLLPRLFEPLFCPPEVAREFGVPLPWLQVQEPAEAALVATLKILVDDGEAEAIALAAERRVRIVLDDGRARAVGRRLGLEMIGTVGLVVQAKRRGLIPAVRPLLDDLQKAGFHMSDGLLEEALRLAGEEPSTAGR